jgi:hypothetical protein
MTEQINAAMSAIDRIILKNEYRGYIVLINKEELKSSRHCIDPKLLPDIDILGIVKIAAELSALRACLVEELECIEKEQKALAGELFNRIT